MPKIQFLRAFGTKLLAIMSFLQQFVDGIGMYRLVSCVLGILAFLSVGAGSLDLLSYSAGEQLFALVTSVALALIFNVAFAKFFKVSANHESAIITSFILFFLFIPGATIIENSSLWLAIFIAISSKYLLAYRKQHIFNAAALGAAAPPIFGLYGATWWVSNVTLFIPLLFLGVLVVARVRRWVPVLWFIGMGLLVYLAEMVWYGLFTVGSVATFFISWPTLFLAFFMLTEPFTMPSRKNGQAWYGSLVGVLSNTTLFSPIFSMTPELALLCGNLATYSLRLRRKLYLKLLQRREIAKNTQELIFEKPSEFRFEAGQYLEWMLPHQHVDSRGIRRYFTIASAPTEKTLRLATRISAASSSFKRELLKLEEGGVIMAGQLAGDFVMPKDKQTKLGFIAGGIGITPFRSHLQYMIDSGKHHDVKLFFCCNEVAELAYMEDFKSAAERLPIDTIAVIAKEDVASPMEHGHVTKEILKRRVPDFLERTWYLSGPPSMVNTYGKLLKKMGVSGRQIKKDFFSGLI